MIKLSGPHYISMRGWQPRRYYFEGYEFEKMRRHDPWVVHYERFSGDNVYVGAYQTLAAAKSAVERLVKAKGITK